MGPRKPGALVNKPWAEWVLAKQLRGLPGNLVAAASLQELTSNHDA